MKIKNTLLVLATGVMMTGILTACGSSGKTVTIDMADYIDVSVSGYDGYGVVEYSFDKDRLMSDHGDDISYSKDLKSEAKKMSDKDRADYIVNDDSIKLSNLAVIASMDGANASKVAKASSDSSAKLLSGLISAEVENLAKYTPEDMFSKFIGCEVSDTEGLSNSDMVTISVKSAEELEEKFNVKFENNPMVYEIVELDEAVEIDPFSLIDIEFTNKSTDGRAEIVNNIQDTTLKSLLKYELSDSRDLSNGDVVIVTVTADEQKLGDKGYKLTSTEKEYVVEGLDYYITSASEIPEEDLAKMQAKAIETINKNLNSRLSLVSADYIGNFFMSKKEIGGITYNNLIYLMYKVTAYNDSTSSGPATVDVYVPIRFGDLLMMGDGTFSYNLDGAYQQGRNVYIGKQYSAPSVTGYESIESAFDDRVASSADNYNYENNVSQS